MMEFICPVDFQIAGNSPYFGNSTFAEKQLILHKRSYPFRMAGKDGGKKKPLKQKKTDKGPEFEEDKAFKAKQKEEQAALKAMREKLGKKK